MIHITLVVLFVLLHAFPLCMVSDPNSLSFHSQMPPVEMTKQEYIHDGIPRNPWDAQ
jgi:hypothetical protein